MKSVILAAGRGTRMRELTAELPKPMLTVQGKPILQHIVEGIAAAGVREFCIITGYRAEVIEEFFGDGRPLDLSVRYARQVVQDGTGKAPELARNFVGDDPFILTYGDILVPAATYRHMVQRFSEGSFAGVVTVTRGEDVSKGGLNFFDTNFCLKRIVEKPGPAEVDRYRAEGFLKTGDPVWYNAGIYLFTPELFRFTGALQKSPRGEYELPDAINALVAGGLTVAGLEVPGRWVDVRDPEVLARLEKGEG